MTTTISWSGGSSSPTLMLGYQAARPSGNVVHELLGFPSIATTMRRAGLRSGTLELLYSTKTAAFDAEAAHILPRTFTVTDTDVAEVLMRYVVQEGKEITLKQDDDRAVWFLSVPFQEVP